LLLILLGLLIGLSTIFSFPVVLTMALAFYLVYVCRKNTTGAQEKKFVTYACILAIGLRVLISIFILTYGRYSGAGSDIFGDAMTYDGVGAYIKELATGAPFKKILWGDNLITVLWLRQAWPDINMQLSGGYTVPNISYWYGYLHMFWGESFLAAKILNGLMWVMGSFWLYVFFRERFVNAKIKYGLIVCLFTPSALIFSSSGLKDSLLFFLIVSIIFSSHMLERSKHRGYAFFALLATPALGKFMNHIGMAQSSFLLTTIFIISVMVVAYNNACWPFWGTLIISSGLLLPTLRPYINYLVILYALSLLLRKIHVTRICIGILTLVIIALFIFKANLLGSAYNHIREQIQNRASESVLQSFNTAYGNTAYRIYPEKFYANIDKRGIINYPEMLVSFVNGLRYLFLEPTIFSFELPVAAIMLPEVLFMWLLAPFIILGGIVILRINPMAAASTLLFLFIITTILALGQGNMGTLIRTRCMIMPWYFMIGVLGLNAANSNLFKQKSYKR
jgi:hypothetical protein